MRIAAVYSFNRGEEEVARRYPDLMTEVDSVIRKVNASKHRTKKSKEKTTLYKTLFCPRSLNVAFKNAFDSLGEWQTIRVSSDHRTPYDAVNHETTAPGPGEFRKMDFVKRSLGIEIQFGKRALPVYSGCAKMTIFNKLGHIDCGIEIVPVKVFANQMSTGVSYFEQFVWDLEHRGVADIDIPVLILGVDA